MTISKAELALTCYEVRDWIALERFQSSWELLGGWIVSGCANHRECD